jgi:hypothetical protein
MFRQVLAVVLLTLPLSPATAAHADAPKVTWTVQPANATAADGRRWIERTLDPGQKVTEHLAVRNLGTTGVVFALTAADGYLTGNGRFNMLASGQPSVDGGTWIAVPPTVAVEAGATRIVPFTITVPAGATPGDHPAGVAASVLSQSGTVQVESRVGFRVMLRAGGAARAALGAQKLTARYERSWNPLRSGAIRLSYTVANTGNVRVDAQTHVSVTEFFGDHDRAQAAGELLPGGSRAAEGRVRGVWGLGPVTAKVLLTPVVLGEAGNTLTSPATAEVTLWVVPWPQLLSLLLLVALVLALRAHRRASRRRLARLLDDARREGHASRKDTV